MVDGSCEVVVDRLAKCMPDMQIAMWVTLEHTAMCAKAGAGVFMTVHIWRRA